MKIVTDWGIDRITRELSGAMWTFYRLRDDNSTATFVHRCFQHEIWHTVKLRERIEICLALPLAPLVTMVLTAVFTAINGPAIKKRMGKGIIRQVHEQMGVALRCAILPPWYYIFELHDDDKRLHASEYMNRFEMKSGLYRYLRDHNGGLPVPAERSTACIKDKACFMARCRKFGIATAPVLLRVVNGKIIPVDWNQSGLPETDLFVKPLMARGVEILLAGIIWVQESTSATMENWLGQTRYWKTCGRHRCAELSWCSRDLESPGDRRSQAMAPWQLFA